MAQTSIQIKITKTQTSKFSNINGTSLQFGKTFTDHMFLARYTNGCWQNFEIKPFENLSISPASSFIHYGQSIFEGMKAHKNPNGQFFLFRPLANINRMAKSAARMCMPEFPQEVFLNALKKLVSIDKAWIPDSPTGALYIRPFMFATDAFLGVKPSESYCFMIILSPSDFYYKEPVKVKVETNFSRATLGGTGAAKAAGNYAGSLYPAKLAMDEGYHQLIWTDSKYHRNIEESGTMNIMFVLNDTLVTPRLSNTILPGITRDTILTIARSWDMPVEERTISVEELIDGIKSGRLKEAFGVGTAATIVQIITVGYNGKDYNLPALNQSAFSIKMSQYLEDYKRGLLPDKFGYLEKV